MVAVDTRNPPGNEARVAGVLREALGGWRPGWTEVEAAPGRLSLLATIEHPNGTGGGRAEGAGGGFRRPRLIVNGHLDVVPVRLDDWSRDPFEPAVIDGRLYGRGSADMKGGIAAAICALDVLERAGRSPAGDIVFHFVADEEVGGRLGTKVLLDRGLIEGDVCLVPEPTGMQLCIAERGLLQAHLTVHGRPGHGSRPREAVSAIEKAAQLVLALHAGDFGGPSHPLLDRPSANVGTIEGGSGINTVAESCRLGLDRRLLPGVGCEAAVAELRSRIEAAGVSDLHYDLDVLTFGEASEMDPADPWVARVADAVRSATGKTPETIGMSFTTDARFVRNQAKIPAVVCGPGEIAQAHANDEWVSVKSLVDATAAYAEVFASFV